MFMFKRIPTRIKLLDEIIQGGFPENSVNLVMGAPGTGKSILALQIAYNSAKNKTPAVFVNTSITKTEQDIIEQAELFGWDLGNKNFKLLCADPHKSITLDAIGGIIRKNNAKILVIDSISEIVESPSFIGTAITLLDKSYYPGTAMEIIYRDSVSRLFRFLKELGVTSIITSEQPSGTREAWVGIIEYLANSLIRLSSFGPSGEIARSLQVVKMQKTKISTFPHPIEVTNRGVNVLPLEKGFDIRAIA